MLDAARKDGQTVTPKGEMLGLERIDGVRVADIRPVLTRSGATIEVFRTDGPFAGFEMQQVNYCPLRPDHASDWHMHRLQNDVVIPVAGEIQIGLYDDREGSPTKGESMMLRLSALRMAAVLIPCGVWHALKNASHEEGAYVVLTDRKYAHADPDDWRLKRDEPALHGIL
jgi:dTDP-4-dehydrorhamnose 3,5-epimerase